MLGFGTLDKAAKLLKLSKQVGDINDEIEKEVKEAKMQNKSLFKSKTFWVNLLGGLIAVGGTVGGLVPPSASPYIMAGGAVANIVLRLLTSQPIGPTS